MRALVLIALLGSGCFDDRYRCTSDAQCNVGEGGRCEIDGYCTTYNFACNSRRQYQHAGEHGNACFDDAVAPLNACAPGQPPASRNGCFTTVCERVPACCDMAWTESCVQLAQALCTDLRCDTRIAITAIRGATVELWDLRWDGTWQVKKRTELEPPLAWLPPAPGTQQPRLAGVSGSTVVIEDRAPLEIDDLRDVSSISAINVDRDRRDTIVVGSVLAGSGTDPRLDVYKLDANTFRSMPVTQPASILWGDLDHDSFADAVVRAGAQYQFILNHDSDGHARQISTSTNVNPPTMMGTGTAPQVRSVEWMDVDGDTRLDLVMFGSEVRFHTDPAGIREMPEVRIDCAPPTSELTCAAAAEPNLEAQSFAGATRPTRTQNEVVISSYPGRKVYRGTFTNGVFRATQLSFPGDSCACTQTCTPPNACTYACESCVPIVALVARDLDGDHQLDLVAIDGKLNLYHALAPMFSWVGPVAIPTSVPNAEGFVQITTSVSGARL